MRGMPDLREGVPAQMHLHREEQRQKARLRGQAANLSNSIRYRYFCLHELPDLCRGVSI